MNKKVKLLVIAIAIVVALVGTLPTMASEEGTSGNIVVSVTPGQPAGPGAVTLCTAQGTVHVTVSFTVHYAHIPEGNRVKLVLTWKDPVRELSTEKFYPSDGETVSTSVDFPAQTGRHWDAGASLQLVQGFGDNEQMKKVIATSGMNLNGCLNQTPTPSFTPTPSYTPTSTPTITVTPSTTPTVTATPVADEFFVSPILDCIDGKGYISFRVVPEIGSDKYLSGPDFVPFPSGSFEGEIDWSVNAILKSDPQNTRSVTGSANSAELCDITITVTPQPPEATPVNEPPEGMTFVCKDIPNVWGLPTGTTYDQFGHELIRAKSSDMVEFGPIDQSAGWVNGKQIGEGWHDGQQIDFHYGDNKVGKFTLHIEISQLDGLWTHISCDSPVVPEESKDEHSSCTDCGPYMRETYVNSRSAIVGRSWTFDNKLYVESSTSCKVTVDGVTSEAESKLTVLGIVYYAYGLPAGSSFDCGHKLLEYVPCSVSVEETQMVLVNNGNNELVFYRMMKLPGQYDSEWILWARRQGYSEEFIFGTLMKMVGATHSGWELIIPTPKQLSSS